jgi:hypothetical protein
VIGRTQPIVIRADIRAFVAVGVTCTVAGGLVAAVTRPLSFELGSWTAAFLVLVGGIAQVALGVGQAWVGNPRFSLQRAELVAWNASVVLTIVGTLRATPALTSAAGGLLVVALGLFLVGSRSDTQHGRAWRAAYRILITFVLLSVPVGLALAWARHR